MSAPLSVLEICAGAGGMALGLERAGYHHTAAVEIDPDAAATLRTNRPGWDVQQQDVREVKGFDYRGVDLIAGGVPCPPFSVAGKQLGAADERDLFPEALRIIGKAHPRAVLLENVIGLLSPKFTTYRQHILDQLHMLDYACHWEVLNASHYGVPQSRPRLILVAVQRHIPRPFAWPRTITTSPTLGQALADLMAANGWEGAHQWAARARGTAPTLVGGSTRHGGADLGPTGAKGAWRKLGVDGKSIADHAPGPDAPQDHLPRLTNPMAARIQGFPDTWEFVGRKTSVYRQIGNAFPPPVAHAVGTAIAATLGATTSTQHAPMENAA